MTLQTIIIKCLIAMFVVGASVSFGRAYYLERELGRGSTFPTDKDARIRAAKAKLQPTDLKMIGLACTAIAVMLLIIII